MATTSFELLRAFYDTDSLHDLTGLLEQHHLRYEVFDTKLRFDATFSQNETQRTYKLFVHKEDLEAAQTLAENRDLEILNQLPEEYYLNEYSTEELLEIVYAPDEWNTIDVLFAGRLLEKRGVAPDPVVRETHRHKKQILEDSPQTEAKMELISGYILCVLGNITGLLIALILLMASKRTASGKRIPWYGPRIHNHAVVMIVLFLISGIGCFGLFASFSYF